MSYIREVRWLIFEEKNGEKSKPFLQQRNGKYGFWEDVPTIESTVRGWKHDKKNDKDIK